MNARGWYNERECRTEGGVVVRKKYDEMQNKAELEWRKECGFAMRCINDDEKRMIEMILENGGGGERAKHECKCRSGDRVVRVSGGIRGKRGIG